MILRANVVVPSIVGTFLVVLAITGNPVSALGGIFSASLVAAKELFNIFLVITFMTALLNALKSLRSDIRMVEPFRLVMKNGHSRRTSSCAGITYVISLFFWPTPAVPLVSGASCCPRPSPPGCRRWPAPWPSPSPARAWRCRPTT